MAVQQEKPAEKVSARQEEPAEQAQETQTESSRDTTQQTNGPGRKKAVQAVAWLICAVMIFLVLWIAYGR